MNIHHIQTILSKKYQSLIKLKFIQLNLYNIAQEYTFSFVLSLYLNIF